LVGKLPLCSISSSKGSSGISSSKSVASKSMSSNSVSSESMSSIADSGNSRGSGNSNRGSGNSGNWSSMSITDWNMRNSMNWGSMSGHNSLAGVGLVCGVVDVRGLNNFLDGVDLVGSWDRDGTGNGDIIRLGNMGNLDDLTGNSTWHSNRDINIVLLDIDLWDNVGELGGDSGVSSDWGSNLGLDNGVGRGGASWDRCRGDGSIRCWGSRDDWSGKGNGVDKVLDRSSDIRSGRLGDG